MPILCDNKKPFSQQKIYFSNIDRFRMATIIIINEQIHSFANLLKVSEMSELFVYVYQR